MLNISNLIRIATLALSALTIILGTAYFYYLINEVGDFSFDINYFYVAVSSLLFVIFYMILALNWHIIVSDITKAKSQRQMLAFFASQPYKYLPTSLFTFSFRAKYSYDLGVSIKNSTVAQLIENTILISSGLYLAAAFYFFSISPQLFIIIVAISLVVYLLLPTSKKLITKRFEINFTKNRILHYFLLSTSGWIVAGLSFYFLTKSIGLGLPAIDTIIVNSASYVAGILAFFSPGGIGVREVIYNAAGVASLAIIAWRLLTLATRFSNRNHFYIYHQIL
jgi:uncharacterized membrane protein YbhN (UPF0104 family)